MDGKTYEFSLPGGGFLSLTELVEVLGVAENNAQNGTAKELVADLDGILKYLILIDAAHPAPANAETYQIGSENYYTAASGSGEGTLSGTNYRTAELDITKIIDNQSGVELTDEELNAETFTYRVTLWVPDKTDPAGIVGYEYVPRTQSDAYTLFGYQEGETAFATDIDRFSGKTFRAWNTLVYRDLVEWDNINGRIVSRTDSNGNIIWKVPVDSKGCQGEN